MSNLSQIPCYICDCKLDDRDLELRKNKTKWKAETSLVLKYFPNIKNGFCKFYCNACIKCVTHFDKHRTNWENNELILRADTKNIEGLECLVDFGHNNSHMCRLCLELVETQEITLIYNDNGIFQKDYIPQLLVTYSPTTDMSRIQNPAVCQKCLDVLQTFDQFYQKCLSKISSDKLKNNQYQPRIENVSKEKTIGFGQSTDEIVPFSSSIDSQCDFIISIDSDDSSVDESQAAEARGTFRNSKRQRERHKLNMEEVWVLSSDDELKCSPSPVKKTKQARDNMLRNSIPVIPTHSHGSIVNRNFNQLSYLSYKEESGAIADHMQHYTKEKIEGSEKSGDAYFPGQVQLISSSQNSIRNNKINENVFTLQENIPRNALIINENEFMESLGPIRGKVSSSSELEKDFHNFQLISGNDNWIEMVGVDDVLQDSKSKNKLIINNELIDLPIEVITESARDYFKNHEQSKAVTGTDFEDMSRSIPLVVQNGNVNKTSSSMKNNNISGSNRSRYDSTIHCNEVIDPPIENIMDKMKHREPSEFIGNISTVSVGMKDVVNSVKLHNCPEKTANSNVSNMPRKNRSVAKKTSLKKVMLPESDLDQETAQFVSVEEVIVESDELLDFKDQVPSPISTSFQTNDNGSHPRSHHFHYSSLNQQSKVNTFQGRKIVLAPHMPSRIKSFTSVFEHFIKKGESSQIIP